MSDLTIAPLTVPLSIDEHGAVRIANSRVSLDSVVVRHRQGLSSEEIVGCFPALQLAEVNAVLAYVNAHPDEIDAYLSKRECEADSTERAWRASWDTAGYKQELLKRAGERKAGHAPPVG